MVANTFCIYALLFVTSLLATLLSTSLSLLYSSHHILSPFSTPLSFTHPTPIYAPLFYPLHSPLFNPPTPIYAPLLALLYSILIISTFLSPIPSLLRFTHQLQYTSLSFTHSTPLSSIHSTPIYALSFTHPTHHLLSSPGCSPQPSPLLRNHR